MWKEVRDVEKETLIELEESCEGAKLFLQEHGFTPYDLIVVSLDGVKIIHTDVSIPGKSKATES